MVATYVVLFAVNGIVLTAAYWLFPKNIVLGTISISRTWAVIHSMGMLALLNTFAVPFVREYELTVNRMLSPLEWMIVYFLLNFAGVWLIARFADQVGMGITSWTVAALMAVALDLVQGAAMMQMEKLRTATV